MRRKGFYEKSRLEEIKSGLDETKFLTSDSYRFFLEKIVRGTTGRYDIKVIFSDGVYTDNQIISVNPIHPYLSSIDGVVNKTLTILGQLAHEVFHIIYTDFKTLETINRMRVVDIKSLGISHPSIDKLDDEEKHLKNHFRKQQLHQSLNIIEDSAIELIGTNYYTGSFRQAIIANNENALANMPSLDDLVTRGTPRLTMFKQACAMYCILGKLKGKLYDEELIELFEVAMPLLDKGRLEPDSWGRLEYAKKIYGLMLPLIIEVENDNKEDEASESYEYTKSDKLSSGGEGYADADIPEIKEDFSKEEREKTKEEMSKAKSDDKDKDPSESEKAGLSSEKEGKDKKDDSDCSKDKGSDISKSDSSAESPEEGSSGDDSDKKKGSDDISSKTPEDSKGMGDKEGKKSSEELKDKEEEEEVKETLEKQLKELEDDVAREEYDKEEQRKSDKEIMEFGKEVKFADIHRGISMNVTRQFDRRDDSHLISQYKKEFEEIKSITRSLTKNLQDVIRYNEDVKNTGLIGGRINKSQLYRRDKRVFYKRNEKSNEADLAILLLVDESGSMSHRNRDKSARLAAMMLYEVCDKLSIPYAVIGFDATFHCPQSNFRHYVDFDSRNQGEKYNLSRITARCDNRDGYSLKYAGEYLGKREERDKILIVISDGEPAHSATGYHGPDAIKDTGRVAKEIENKDIQVFGLAIGDGKTAIKRIYTKNFIDIPNLKTLPSRLVKIVEANLLKD